jgi:hypothetical protein
MKPLTWLDLRLMLRCQPAMAALLGFIVVLTFLLLNQPAPNRDLSSAPGLDPARVIAAQRTFHGILIPADGLSAAQQSVLDAASQHVLQVGAVEHGQEPDPLGGFTVASMRMPVSGSYNSIRAFIDQILTQQPALSIRHMVIQREQRDDSPTLNAALTLQFFVGRSTR